MATVEPVLIGDATLYLADCMDVLPTLADGSIDCVIADPPYGIGYQSNRGGYNGNARATDSSFGPDIYDPAWMASAFRVLRRDIFAVVWSRWDMLSQFKADLQMAGFHCIERLIWDKAHWGMGDLRYYGSQAEDALLLRKGAPVMKWKKRRGNIWRYPSKAYFPEGDWNHPAQKPLGVICDWLRDLTDEDNIILDPFMGSGTTGVACAKLGRKFIGIEISEEYFQIACKRIEDAYKQMRLPV